MPHRHLHARQRKGENEEVVATVVSVVMVTMENTFTGDVVWVTQSSAPKPSKKVSLIEPAVRTKDDDDEGETTTTAFKAKATPSVSSSHSAHSTPRKTSHSSQTALETDTESSSSNLRTATTLMVATSSPLPVAAIASASGSAEPSSTGAPVSGGMSTGAKAGLALGLLFGIGALLTAVLILYNRKKNRMQQQAKFDDEKKGMQETATPARSASTRTMSTAPRLSLRTVSQFLPALPGNRKSAGTALDAAGGLAPPGQQKSAWERTGAANAEAPNPFQDPQNPFGNHASTDNLPATANTPEVRLNAFADPAPAIAAAEAADVPGTASAGALIVRKEVPAPLSVRSEAGSIGFDNPSPAWTEDIPASPGPAPSGPPPMAGAVGVARGSLPPGPAGPQQVHRVQLDFKPSMEDELGLHAGQLVRIVHEYDDGWALCSRMDGSQQGVVPRTCLSKHPVKPRNGPPRPGPPGPPRMRGPPPMNGRIPQPRPLTPNGGRNSPQPFVGPNGRMSPAPNGRMSPAPNGRMSPAPRAMGPGPQAFRPMPPPGSPRARSNSNAPYAGPPRSMSPGPYGGGHQQPPQSPQMGRPRSNSASEARARRLTPPGPSPMNPNPQPLAVAPVPARKPVPGLAL